MRHWRSTASYTSLQACVKIGCVTPRIGQVDVFTAINNKVVYLQQRGDCYTQVLSLQVSSQLLIILEAATNIVVLTEQWFIIREAKVNDV